MGTVVSLDEAKDIRARAKQAGQRFVFTNGCFDVLHRGHVEYLAQARALGQLLVVGLNSDRSVRALKGPGRPVSRQADRAYVLSALTCVDQVLIFDALTPAHIIETLVPDILVKGGDWPVEQIVGREVVEANGGRVVSLDSSVPDYSSSRLMERISAGEWLNVQEGQRSEDGAEAGQADEYELVIKSLRDSALVKQQLAQRLGTAILQAATLVARALDEGHKILLCGNGGSAADAQHIAAELVGRFQLERDGLPAIALTTDSSILTAVGNDYGFEHIFARQLKALARPGDVLIAISTSGNSDNIVRAVAVAAQLGVTTIGLLGKDGGKLAGMVNLALVAPSFTTSRIQEAHITIGHIVCELVDRKVGKTISDNS